MNSIENVFYLGTTNEDNFSSRIENINNALYDHSVEYSKIWVYDMLLPIADHYLSENAETPTPALIDRVLTEEVVNQAVFNVDTYVTDLSSLIKLEKVEEKYVITKQWVICEIYEKIQPEMIEK